MSTSTQAFGSEGHFRTWRRKRSRRRRRKRRRRRRRRRSRRRRRRRRRRRKQSCFRIIGSQGQRTKPKTMSSVQGSHRYS